MTANITQKWIVNYFGFKKENGAWSGPRGHGPTLATVVARGHRDAKQKYRELILAQTGQPAPKGAVIFTWPKGETGDKKRQIL